jgi:hypothetical protein
MAVGEGVREEEERCDGARNKYLYLSVQCHGYSSYTDLWCSHQLLGSHKSFLDAAILELGHDCMKNYLSMPLKLLIFLWHPPDPNAFPSAAALYCRHRVGSTTREGGGVSSS